MNKTEFSRKIHDTLNTYDVNLSFIYSWYQEVFNSLKSIKTQAAGIQHPRHLGDFLENELSKVLKGLLPKQYLVDKGFLLNNFSGFSQEQDILIIDTSLGSAICKTDGVGYYPVESAIGAIEVKSNLNLSELRKCLVSCVSVKKLFFSPFEYIDAEDKRFFYAIFAYTTSCKQQSLEQELVSCLEKIPEPLRPNLIYILDQGLYFPTTNGRICLDLESIQTTTEGYEIIKNSANNHSESQNIVLFFSMLIEHAFQQSSVRKPTRYSSYSITPSIWENNIKKTQNPKKQVRKLINRYVCCSEKHDGVSLIIFEEKCDICCKEYKFYVLPPGTKSMRSNIESDLKAKGCLPLPQTKKHICSCGKELDIKEVT